MPLLPAAICLALLAAPAPATGRLTPQEAAGKRLYLTGESPSGGVVEARLGRDRSPLPGSALACGGCHGADGLGRPEGGARPTELTWSSLTRRYGHVHAGGRSHPAFDERSLARAIAEGVDPAGHALDPTMPRYTLPADDLAALLAYLRRIEEDADPGVGERTLRIGTVLPTAGRLAEVGQAMQKVLESAFAELNARGGIHGRELSLEVAGYDSDAETGQASLERLLGRGSVLALVSGFTPGAEAEVAALVERERVPLVGPFTPRAGAGEPGGFLFQLLPGLREEARVLSEHASRLPGPARDPLALVAPGEPALDGAVEAAVRQLRARQVNAAVRRYGPGEAGAELAAWLRQERARTVIFLGEDADLEALGRAAAAAGQAPDLLLPGTRAARGASRLPPAFQGHVFLTYPSLPSDERPAALAALARIRERAGLGERHRLAQLSGYTSALVLAEALKRAGRQLSRERLLASLEGLYDFETGLLPPLRFGPGRHVGALGAYVVALDLEKRSFKQASPWLALD